MQKSHVASSARCQTEPTASELRSPSDQRMSIESLEPAQCREMVVQPSLPSVQAQVLALGRVLVLLSLLVQAP